MEDWKTLTDYDIKHAGAVCRHLDNLIEEQRQQNKKKECDKKTKQATKPS